MHFVGYLYIMDLINERTMEHFKVTLHYQGSFLAATPLGLLYLYQLQFQVIYVSSKRKFEAVGYSESSVYF